MPFKIVINGELKRGRDPLSEQEMDRIEFMAQVREFVGGGLLAVSCEQHTTAPLASGLWRFFVGSILSHAPPPPL